jgi:hypothetical protein
MRGCLLASFNWRGPIEISEETFENCEFSDKLYGI